VLLIVLPWLLVGWALGVGTLIGRNDRAARTEPGTAKVGGSGPWGNLEVTPIVIAPPLEFIGDSWGGLATDAPDRWHFSDSSIDALDALLRSCGLDAAAVARLRAEARPDAAAGGLVVTPDPELVIALPPEVRARLYLALAKDPLNVDQAQAFRFSGNSAEEWLGGSLISDETKRLIEPLIYRQGGLLHFADVNSLRRRVTDPEERRRTAKVLLRQSTFLVRLRIEEPSQVEGLADYWGRGGRRTDLRPLLESVAAGGEPRRIDIGHLLPAFARGRLYRYPAITVADLNRPLLANCLWTALNFFNSEPDDRFLDPNVAFSALQNDYYVIESGFELGDIVAFVDEGGKLFHVVVYLADNLVFGKNGTSPVAPWAVQSIDQVKAFYYVRSAAPQLLYHRARGR
jgi:hypothetical protein